MKNVPVIPMKGLCLASKLGFSFLYTTLPTASIIAIPQKTIYHSLNDFDLDLSSSPTQTPVPLLISLLSTRLALLKGCELLI